MDRRGNRAGSGSATPQAPISYLIWPARACLAGVIGAQPGGSGDQACGRGRARSLTTRTDRHMRGRGLKDRDAAKTDQRVAGADRPTDARRQRGRTGAALTRVYVMFIQPDASQPERQEGLHEAGGVQQLHVSASSSLRAVPGL